MDSRISSAHGRRTRLPLTRSLQAAYDRVTRLAALANVLCSHRGVAAFSGEGLAQSLSFIARELNQAARALASRVPTLGVRGRSRKARASGAFPTLLAQLRAGCLACGQTLSALLGMVRQADSACAQIVYELLRSLERQLWLLQPYTNTKNPHLVLTA